LHEHPARLARAGVTAARDGVAELAVRVLRVLLQIANRFQPLRSRSDRPVEHESCIEAETFWPSVFSRGWRGEDTVSGYAGVAVAEGRTAHGRRAVPAGGRRCAGTLRDVLIDLEVIPHERR
jgi:hypothetical protein